MHYIDIDWNEVLVYQNETLVHQEAAMVLRDLQTEKLLFVGDEAKIHLKDKGNLLAILPIENKKILAYLELNILLNYIIKKLALVDVAFVDRYFLNQKQIHPPLKFISEIDFIKTRSQNKNYLELRNNETQIFDLSTNQIQTIRGGKYKILHYLQRFFYLNYRGLLNTKKTLELFAKLRMRNADVIELKNRDG